MADSDPALEIRRRRSAFSSLRHRDFRLLWMGQIVSVTGSQMQMAAINWHIYLLTGSPLALGLVGACRAVPIILCSLMGGVVADVVDRRRLMMVTQSIMLGCSATLAFVTFSGMTKVWPIFVLTAIASAAWAFDTPARQSLLPMLVPLHDFQNAVSLGMLMFQTGLITGPPLAGFILASHGPGFVYLINAGSFVADIFGFSQSTVADLCERHSAGWRARLWLLSGGPGRGSNHRRPRRRANGGNQKAGRHRNRFSRDLRRGHDRIRRLKSVLVFASDVGGDWRG